MSGPVHRPPPSDADLELLEQALGRDAIAASLGVVKTTVDAWIRAAKRRNPKFGTMNAYASQLASTARSRQKKDAKEAADLASRIDLCSMRAVARVFDELARDAIDPKVILDIGRFGHDIQTSGHYTRRAGRVGANGGKSHDELLASVRKATQAAAEKHGENVLPFEVPTKQEAK